MKKILISGGAGFIGSHLAAELVKKKYEVVILDNFSPQIHGKKYDLRRFDNVEVIKGDVRKAKDWEKALNGVEVVFHFAAETGTGQSMYKIKKYNDVNVLGTAVLLEALSARENNVKKVILSSSRAVYGEGKYHCKRHGIVYPRERSLKDMKNGDFSMKCPLCGKEVKDLPTDEYAFTNPVSIYAITKLAQEQLILNACKSLNIPAVALRYQNVYGPGQSLKNPYTGILSIFSTRFLKNKPVYIFEDGEESRDFVFISDIVKANVLAMNAKKVEGEIINVGTGKKISVLEVADRLKNLYKSKSEIILTGEFRKGDIRHNYADMKKLKEKLNFVPKVAFSEGLAHFTEWVKKQEVSVDLYEKSLSELKEKGLLK